MSTVEPIAVKYLGSIFPKVVFLYADSLDQSI